jgi:glycosyltransferase involved in cell wall biosynthesis
MPKLSVVIITLNEEKNLERCITSAREISDEILVVDSYSTDKTEEIARSQGARFIQHKFIDYMDQHQFADREATYDHILTLDADEELSPELIESIRIVKKYWKNDAYFLNRMTNYCGKWIRHSGWYPDKKLRLYDRNKGKWIGKKVHERFILIEGSTTGHLKGDLRHYSFYSIEDHILQANKFSTLGALALVEHGKRIPKYYLVMKPVMKFIRNYVLKFGFLDGIYGFIICRITATETFYKYSKAYHLQKLNKKDPL